jgi:glycosyltransferase involved in cell wall biosynthesis
VLLVSQLLPHKRQDVLIGMMHLLQHVHGSDLGLVLIGPARLPSYSTALHKYAHHLRVKNVWFAGQVSNAQLATAYRRARVVVSASEHEGIGISPLEAMSFGVPTVVRDAGAVAETVGDASLLLPPDAGPELFAEAVALLLADCCLGDVLVRRGIRRVLHVSPDQSADVDSIPAKLLGSLTSA